MLWPSSEVRVRPVLPGLAVPDGRHTRAGRRCDGASRVGAGTAASKSRRHGRAKLPRASVRAPRDPQEGEAAAPPAAAEAPRRRNLLFASTSRKERERAEAKLPEDAPPPAEPGEAPNIPPANFDAAWPKPDRTRPPEPPVESRRPPRRSPSSLAETAPPPAPRTAPTGRAAAGDGPQIRRRRRHGLFALFRRLDRGADAGGHDALCLDRRAPIPSRPARLRRSPRKYGGAAHQSSAHRRQLSQSSRTLLTRNTLAASIRQTQAGEGTGACRMPGRRTSSS